MNVKEEAILEATRDPVRPIFVDAVKKRQADLSLKVLKNTGKKRYTK